MILEAALTAGTSSTTYLVCSFIDIFQRTSQRISMKAKQRLVMKDLIMRSFQMKMQKVLEKSLLQQRDSLFHLATFSGTLKQRLQTTII